MEFLPKCCFFGSASTSTKQPSTSIEDICHRFSLSQLQESTNNFDPSQQIGQGGFGVVYRGCISIDGELKKIAVKRRSRTAHQVCGEKENFEFRNEILFLSQLHHPNLVSLVGFCEDKHEMIVVYEYMPSRSLDLHLYGRNIKSTKLSWKKRLEISIGTARGLHYLHVGTKRTIIHRAVKTSNILLDENWIPKLSDFGLCLKGLKYSSKAKFKVVDTVVGRTEVLAPEYAIWGKITDKSDVYNFGTVLLELMCGKQSGQIYREVRESENKEEVNMLPHQSVEKSEVDQESEYDGLSEDASPSFGNIAERVRNLAEKGNAENIIDPFLVGEIAPECWKLYMDIAESCSSEDPNERPHMGEVEVELERVLELQEEADANQSFHAFFSI